MSTAAAGRDSTTAGFDEGQFRRVAGSFCSGIVIVTSWHAGRPVGLTCQSFFSLSLKPPLIAISVSNTSTTFPRIRQAGKFAVNVLSSRQRRLSDQFAARGADKWTGVSYRNGAIGVPVLHEVVAVLECDMEEEYDTGDHHLVVGRVRAIDHDAERDPLVYFRSSYRALHPAELPGVEELPDDQVAGASHKGGDEPGDRIGVPVEDRLVDELERVHQAP